MNAAGWVAVAGCALAGAAVLGATISNYARTRLFWKATLAVGVAFAASSTLWLALNPV